MKTLLVPVFTFVSLQARASIDCGAKIVSDGKTTESKIEMKETKVDLRHQFEAEKDGYIFQAEMNDPDPDRFNGLVVIEKASKRRSVSRYGGMKLVGPDAYFSTALILEEGAHANVVQLICHPKK